MSKKIVELLGSIFLKKMMAMMNKLSAMTVYQVQVLRNGPCDNFSKEEPNHFSPFSSVHMIFTFSTHIVG